ncbi:MAG: hypothetical protein Q7J35_14680 [Candidatus Methanoperedens sp.]|nr:hypothetical protein [Candidatus Methanoperedens sp.]
MNYCRRVVIRDKRNWIDALKPKGTKSGYSGSNYIIENGHQIFGSKVAPKISTIIHSMELGKPYVFPMGRSLVRDDNDTEGKGYGKKQVAARNKLHRGIALIRKDADFPLVSHCMNRDKLRNMRKSITPNGEMLINTKCYWAVNWNYKGRVENCRPILKGYGLLEPYAVKVASTVLRRGRAGNRSSLFDN